MLKVGLELFSAAGPEAVGGSRRTRPVFLDLKLHDIPKTVERAARQHRPARACAMLTVHALGGEAMVRGGGARRDRGADEAGFAGSDRARRDGAVEPSGEGLAIAGLARVRGDVGGLRRRRGVGRGRARRARGRAATSLSRRAGRPAGGRRTDTTRCAC